MRGRLADVFTSTVSSAADVAGSAGSDAAGFEAGRGAAAIWRFSTGAAELVFDSVDFSAESDSRFFGAAGSSERSERMLRAFAVSPDMA